MTAKPRGIEANGCGHHDAIVRVEHDVASRGEAMDARFSSRRHREARRAAGVSERPVDREPELLVVDGHADFIALHSRTAERVREGMATVPDRDLLDLERQGWTALTKGGDAAAEFYGHVLAEQVLMLLPGGMVLNDRARRSRRCG